MKATQLSIYSAALLFLWLGSGCSSSRQSQQSGGYPISAWQKQSLTIDGSDSDWAGPLPYYVPEEKMGYAVSNNGTNLYIRLSVKDPQEQQKILQGGMTIWVNRTGDKSNETAVGIGFPLDNSKDRDRQIMEQARPDQYKDKPVSLDDMNTYSLYGFTESSPASYDYGQANPEGIEVKMDYNKAGNMIYEALIPLKAIFPKNDPHYYFGREIAVGIFVEGVPSAPGRRRSGGGLGGVGIGIGGGMGMGGFGGGGLGMAIGGGSMIGGGGGRKDNQSTPGKIWQVVTVAKQPVGVGAENQPNHK
jgi:hypothetical protein